MEDILFSSESERVILSAALNEDRRPLLHSLTAVLASDDFHEAMHQQLWACLQSLSDANASTSPSSVLDFANANGIFVGGPEYIVELLNEPFAKAARDESVVACGQRIKNLSTVRRLKMLLERGLKLCDQGGMGVDDLLGNIEDDLLNLRKLSESRHTGPQHVRNSVDGVLEELQKRMDGEPDTLSPIGIDGIDAIIPGLGEDDFVVIGARPSMGKTALMNNMARSSAKLDVPVLIFSLEMNSSALTRRMMAAEGRVGLSGIRSGQMQDSDFSRLFEGAQRLGELGVYIDDTPGLSMAEIRSRARTFVQHHGKCRIFIDYLQFVSRSKATASPGFQGKDEKSHVSEVSRAMKNLARELKCPVIALSQLSRNLESRTNKRPMMSDLRESGAIEQDADIIIFLYRDVVYNSDTPDPNGAEAIVAKQRDGAIGTAMMHFEPSYQVFV